MPLEFLWHEILPTYDIVCRRINLLCMWGRGSVYHRSVVEIRVSMPEVTGSIPG